MSRTTLSLSGALYDYMLEMGVREDEVQRRLRKETGAMAMGRMQISPEQGALMAMLIHVLGARRVLEIGVFTGYSTLSVAKALPVDGRVVACDISEEWTAIARRYWEEAGVAHKIDLYLRPGLETLDTLLRDGAQDSFDFAFIDADKGGYLAYYERCLQLLRVGGVIAVDNVLWGGRVIDADDTDEDTQAIRQFNAALRDDARIDVSLVPIGDGVTLARKR